jgi:uncharacterized protein YaaQ
VKLLVTIVQDQDVPVLLDTLMKEGFSATKLASTGGFLRTGNTTLLIGVDDEKVESALELIGRVSSKREQYQLDPLTTLGSTIMPKMDKVTVGGAIVFVVDVERFEKI